MCIFEIGEGLRCDFSAIHIDQVMLLSASTCIYLLLVLHESYRANTDLANVLSQY